MVIWKAVFFAFVWGFVSGVQNQCPESMCPSLQPSSFEILEERRKNAVKYAILEQLGDEVNVDEEPDLTPIPIEVLQLYELENKLDKLRSDECEEHVESGSDISIVRRTFRVSPESAEFSKHRSFQENLKNRLWITFNMDDLDAIDGSIRTAKLRVHKVRTKEHQQFPVTLFQLTDYPLERHLLATKNINSNFHGWLEFDITDSVKKWVGMMECEKKC